MEKAIKTMFGGYTDAQQEEFCDLVVASGDPKNALRVMQSICIDFALETLALLLGKWVKAYPDDDLFGFHPLMAVFFARKECCRWPGAAKKLVNTLLRSSKKGAEGILALLCDTRFAPKEEFPFLCEWVEGLRDLQN